MKLRNYLIVFIVFIIVGVVLYIYDYKSASYVSFGFGVMILVTFTTSKVMERSKIKKLDSKYYVLTKEELLKQYVNLTKEVDDEKLKQVILAYFEFKEEYSLNTLKRFGLWLTKNYKVDPSGIDEGIVVLFVNIHELMIEDLIKDIKEKLKEAEIFVDFKYGYAIYKTNEEYEDLKNRAIKNIK